MCVLEEKMDFELTTSYSISYVEMDKKISLNCHHCSTRIQRRPLLTIGLNGTEARLFVCSFCLAAPISIILKLHCLLYA